MRYKGLATLLFVLFVGGCDDPVVSPTPVEVTVNTITTVGVAPTTPSPSPGTGSRSRWWRRSRA